jgi:hypothetical protein
MSLIRVASCGLHTSLPNPNNFFSGHRINKNERWNSTHTLSRGSCIKYLPLTSQPSSLCPPPRLNLRFSRSLTAYACDFALRIRDLAICQWGVGVETYGSRCAGTVHLHRSALSMRKFVMGWDEEYSRFIGLL